MKKNIVMVALMLAVGIAVSGCASHEGHEGHDVPAAQKTGGGHGSGCH